jgi:hypothetical protein
MWRPPGKVDAGMVPHVAMAGSGATLVWLALETVSVVKARTYKDGGTWDPPVYLQDKIANSYPNAAAPKVAMNAHGVTLVTWKQEGNSEYDAAVTYRLPVLPGNGWANGARVTDDVAGGTSDPVVGIGASDVGTWLYGSVSYIRATLFDTDGLVGSAGTVSNVSNPSSCPWVSVNARGDAMGTWIEKPATSPWIVIGWFCHPYESVPVPLASLGTGAAGTLGCPRVAMDDLGRAIAVWTVGSGAAPALMYSTYDPMGTGWAATAAPIDTGGLGAFNADVVLSPTGEGFVVWEQGMTGAPTMHDVRALHFQLGRALDAGGARPVGATAPATSAHVAVTATGAAVAVWAQGDRILSSIFSGGGWGPAAPIDTMLPSYTSQNPDLATDGQGRALAAWESTTGGIPDVVVARFE